MNKSKMERLAKLALENGRDYSELQEIKPIQGGSINEAFYVRTTDNEYFMKFHANSPKDFFKSEAIGLRLIKETKTVSVPNYYSYSDQPGNAFLLMEWIEGVEADDTEVILGQKVAKLHKSFGRMHGFKNDTYIGLLRQPNKLLANWLEYFGTYRLGSQIEQGVERGVIQGERHKKLEKLLERLDEWVPSFVEPSHLHGDFYSGNWIVGPGGEPFLVDPSFLYGDRQLDMAFTELFGGFSQTFYDAYNEVFPLRADYEDVKPLYQLYYLLAHLNMFGETYGPQVDAIVNRYVGD